MPSTDPVIIARNNLARLSSFKSRDADAIDAARRDLAYAHIERAITERLPASPLPLKSEQRARLAQLLEGGADRG